MSSFLMAAKTSCLWSARSANISVTYQVRRSTTRSTSATVVKGGISNHDAFTHHTRSTRNRFCHLLRSVVARSYFERSQLLTGADMRTTLIRTMGDLCLAFVCYHCHEWNLICDKQMVLFYWCPKCQNWCYTYQPYLGHIKTYGPGWPD